jgi:small-conductance mechanosensitive channel
MTLARFIENRVMNVKSKSFRANQRIVVIKVLKILLYIFAIVIVLTSLGIDLSFLTFFGVLLVWV